MRFFFPLQNTLVQQTDLHTRFVHRPTSYTPTHTLDVWGDRPFNVGCQCLGFILATLLVTSSIPTPLNSFGQPLPPQLALPSN